MPWIAPKVGIIDGRGRVYCLSHLDAGKGEIVDVVREPAGGTREAYMPALESHERCEYPGCGARLIDADVPARVRG